MQTGPRRGFAAAVLALGVAAAVAQPQAVSDADLQSVRVLMGGAPGPALQRIAELRLRADGLVQLDRRLTLDELECRLQQDNDRPAARSVAERGAQEVARLGARDVATRLAAWRLAACGAASALDLGRIAQGSAELERIIEATLSDPALQPALAMARLERGVYRSRRGDLIAGQADLLAACEALAGPGLQWELELCRWHLALHYKRTGDFDEALHLAEPLLAAARLRHATADVGVYALGIGQMRLVAVEPGPALEPLREALVAAQEMNDPVGMSYAESSLSRAHLMLGQLTDALRHARRAVELLPPGADPVQAAHAGIGLAAALNAQRQGAAALAALDAVAATVAALDRPAMRRSELRERAQALALLGRWSEAYGAMNAKLELDDSLERDRQSAQAARLRGQFNRERDMASLGALRSRQALDQQLLHTQTAAIGLGALLFTLLTVFAVRKGLQARALHRLAMVDELTGLPNRRAVQQRLADAFRQARRQRQSLSLLMVDLDRFKAVNDTHGHAVGDQVLRHVAQVLAGVLRSGDWAGRLGGEEFLVVLPGAAAAQAADVAERMRRAVAESPCIGPAGPLPVTVSIGVGALDDAAQSADELVDRADVLLYRAKREGRNLVCA